MRQVILMYEKFIGTCSAIVQLESFTIDKAKIIERKIHFGLFKKSNLLHLLFYNTH